MIKKISSQKNAIIILHEIYGVNKFIEETCLRYYEQGFDVYCPKMLGKIHFQYFEELKAYDYFSNRVGFDFYRDIEQLLEEIKDIYNKVFILGFSVGATIAWRCCENSKCNGIICCYGSRIRNYLMLKPTCPVLLLFAEQDSFDVENTVGRIREKCNTETYRLQAGHGFIDPYSPHFNEAQANTAEVYITHFLKNICEAN